LTNDLGRFIILVNIGDSPDLVLVVKVLVNSLSKVLTSVRDNLDSLLASIGAVLSLILIFYIQTRIGQPVYTLTAVLAFVACVAYLALKWRWKLSDIPSFLDIEATSSWLLLLDIIFFALFIYSLWSFAFRAELYIRPLGYFISISAMSAILAVKILFLPSRNPPILLTIFQIVLVALSLQWSVLFLFPDVVGMDTGVHRLTVLGWLNSGHIEGGVYQRLPMMHLTIGATSLITGLGYKMATMFSVSLLQAVCNAIFIFLIGRLLFNAKIGLLAALLMGIANWYIFFGYWTVPNALGATLVVINLYLVFKLHKDRATVVIPIFGLLMVALILTHAIAALWLAMLLFGFWLIFIFYNRFFKERLATSYLLIIALFFIAVMLNWWTFGSGDMQTLVRQLRGGFEPSAGLTYAPGSAPSAIAPPEVTLPEVKPPEVTPPEAIPPATETLSAFPVEFMFNSLGMLLFFAMALIGGFYMLSRRFDSPYTFFMAIAGVLILGIGYFPMLIGRSVIEHRWWYMAEMLLSIPLAVTISILFGLFRKRYLKAVLVVVLVLVVAFLSMIGFPSNQTNRALSQHQVVRFALTTSELQAMQTVSALYDGTIGVDGYYFRIQLMPEFLTRLAQRLEWIQSYLINNDFSQCSSNMLLIREEIVDHPFGTGSGSYYKLNYDPRQALTEQGFDKVYECGSVSGFIR
jgi:hypothetical protein